jgi:hypothetical protein
VNELNIQSRIIKEYLKNVYFINGTAYAGKSTMTQMIAERQGLYLCGENYNYDHFLSLSTIEEQPNMNYFKTMSGWEAFVTRSPEEYRDWMEGVSRELVPFEIAELISLSRNQKVIVDTSIPVDVLKEISDEKHVAIMLTTTEQSVNAFFEREDREKQFLLRQIMMTKNPEKTMQTYKEGLALINGEDVIQKYLNSGFKCFFRNESISLEERYKEICQHFGFIE